MITTTICGVLGANEVEIVSPEYGTDSLAETVNAVWVILVVVAETMDDDEDD